MSLYISLSLPSTPFGINGLSSGEDFKKGKSKKKKKGWISEILYGSTWYKHAVLSICYQHFTEQAFLLFCSINWKKFLLLSINLFPCNFLLSMNLFPGNFHPMVIILPSGQCFLNSEGRGLPQKALLILKHSQQDIMSLLKHHFSKWNISESSNYLFYHMVSWLILILLTLLSQWVLNKG